MTDDNQDFSIRCAFCSKHVPASERVRYRGFIAHNECARINREKRITGFDRRPFIIGAIGALVAIISSVPLIILVLGTNNVPVLFYLDYSVSYIEPATTYALTAVVLPLIAIGVFGYYKNFQSLMSLVCCLLTLVTAVFFGSTASILFSNGADPSIIDSNTSLLQYGEIAGFELAKSVALILGALVAISLSVLIVLTEGTLGSEKEQKAFATFFVLVGALLFAIHLVIIFQYAIYMILFLRVRIPEEWKEEPTLDESAVSAL